MSEWLSIHLWLLSLQWPASQYQVCRVHATLLTTIKTPFYCECVGLFCMQSLIWVCDCSSGMILILLTHVCSFLLDVLPAPLLHVKINFCLFSSSCPGVCRLYVSLCIVRSNLQQYLVNLVLSCQVVFCTRMVDLGLVSSHWESQFSFRLICPHLWSHMRRVRYGHTGTMVSHRSYLETSEKLEI